MDADGERVAWRPTPEYAANANVTRLIERMGASDIDDLRRITVADIGAYWRTAIDDLEIPFSKPFDRVFDDSAGIEWTKWFTGGEINVAAVCVDRFADDQATADRPAVICEHEDGTIEQLTFGELRAESDALAAGLAELGVARGDRVAVYMPMVPQAIVAAYAIAKLGAVYMPVFSGFAAPSVATRLIDAGAVAVITADGGSRRGRPIAMKPVIDEAVNEAPTVRHVVVARVNGLDTEMVPGRDLEWDAVVGPHRGERFETVSTGAEDTFMIAYTSGTTGKPKGVVHVHGGLTVKLASESAYSLDVHAGERFLWVTDMGWIMGPVNLIGAHANGATMVMVEGAPDWPDPARVWRLTEQQQINILGISPTLIRALRARGEEWTVGHDLSSLRILGSTGEPWNAEPYRWLMRVTGGYVPIINISGGTEVGACFLTPHPVEPIKECSLGGASLGMDIDVFDEEGKSVRGRVGELVCKQPWPGMTRGFLGDHERYIETYWTMYPGIWRHGDWAMVDEDGDWFLFGRSDEAINVAGKRLGPAEVESILVADPRIAEAAAVGVPDDTKGEAVWCFAVPRPGAVAAADEAGVASELAAAVADDLGKAFKPSRVVIVPALPKTRSAKILRRSVRAVAIGEDPGDLSSAENPESLVAIAAALDRPA